jgi:hypothetical protein
MRRAGIVEVCRPNGMVSSFGTREDARMEDKTKGDASRYMQNRTTSRLNQDAVAKRIKQSRGHVYREVDDQAGAFLRPNMVRVLLLSRAFLSEFSFFVERPERTDRESEPSSMYLSL